MEKYTNFKNSMYFFKEFCHNLLNVFFNILDNFCNIPFLNEFIIFWISFCFLFCNFLIKFDIWKFLCFNYSQLQEITLKTLKILIILNVYITFIADHIRFWLNLKDTIYNITYIPFGSNLFFDNNLINTYFTTYLKMILLVLIYIALKYWFDFINKNKQEWISIKEFPFMFLGSSLFLSLTLSTNNLFLMIFTIIGMSICFYVLLAINSKFGTLAREASIKYFILSALSSGLILGGAKEIYLISGTATFNNINDFLTFLITDYTNIQEIFTIKYALIFIFSGFLFKLSAAPNHFWAPEIYEGLPYALISFIILPIKFAIGFLFLRLFKTIFTIFAFTNFDNLLINSEIEIFLITTIIFSMLVGGLNAMYEQKIKRFIAYSSINQIGFLFIGLLGTNSSVQGIEAFIYFFIVYIINLTLFLNLIIYFTKHKYYWYNLETTNVIEREDLNNLIYITDFPKIFQTKFLNVIIHKNAFLQKNNIATQYFILFPIILFSLAGIPPLIGFFGKFYILLYAFKLKYFIIILIGILISIISVFYYLRILKTIFFEEEQGSQLENFTKIALLQPNITIKKNYMLYILKTVSKIFKKYKIFIFFLLFISPIFFDNFLIQQSFELTQSCYILIH